MVAEQTKNRSTWIPVELPGRPRQIHSRWVLNMAGEQGVPSCSGSPDSAALLTDPKGCRKKIVKRDNDGMSQYRVRFQGDTEDECVSLVVEPSWELTKELRHSMWWQKADRIAAVAAATACIEEYMDSGSMFSETMQSAIRVLSCCVHLPNQEVALTPESDERGLESRLFPNLVFQRFMIVDKVLSAQERLPADLEPKQRAMLLGRISRALTKPSRRLARYVGISDAAIAKHHIQPKEN